VIDVADRHDPKLIVHRNWSPPFGGGTHNCLPLPDRNLLVVLDEAVMDARGLPGGGRSPAKPVSGAIAPW
jgi:hypothetical protein